MSELRQILCKNVILMLVYLLVLLYELKIKLFQSTVTDSHALEFFWLNRFI